MCGHHDERCGPRGTDCRLILFCPPGLSQSTPRRTGAQRGAAPAPVTHLASGFTGIPTQGGDSRVLAVWTLFVGAPPQLFGAACTDVRTQWVLVSRSYSGASEHSFWGSLSAFSIISSQQASKGENR